MSLRFTEAEYAAYVRRGQPPALTEAAWQSAVMRLLKDAGYMAYHTYSSKRSPEGFPDLICARAGSPLLAIELKTDTGQVTTAQQAWLEALAGCTGVVSEVWRPSALDTIIERLRL